MSERGEGYCWALEKGTTLLEASAGTGKTHSITDRYLWLVVGQDVDVSKVLVVTFTEAATAELRDRIRSRLRRALELLQDASVVRLGDGSDVALLALVQALGAQVGTSTAVRRLEAALRDFDQAEISTIHGFCKRSLQRHAFESGVEFDAELVTDLGPLVEEVVTDFWVRRHHDAHEDLVRALAMAGVTPAGLVKLAGLVAEYPDMPVDMATALDVPTVPEAFERWRAAWREARDAWLSGRDEAVIIVREAVMAGKIPRIVGAAIPDDESFGRWVDEVDRFLTVESEPGSPLPGRLSPVFTCDVKKAFQARQQGHPVFDALRRLIAEDAAIGTSLFNEVRQISLDCIETARRDVPARKRERRVQTFSDLLYLLRDALRSDDLGPTLRAALRERYDAALIDEFQDTDHVQWEIFARVFGDGDRWLCLIGDPKQAIYSFRGADIHTYLAAKNTAKETSSLETNYRSDEGLVEAVNHLFDEERLPDAFVLKGIDYAHVEAHHLGSRLRFERPRPPFEIRFCRRDGAELARNGAIKAPWVRERVVRLVAADVAALLGSRPEIAADEMSRPLGPRDVAVLVRTNKEARSAQDALRDAGIPSVLHGTESVFATSVAQDLVHVLAAILEPSRAGAVKTAVSTELIGLRARELFELEEQSDQWDEWTNRLRDWQKSWISDGFMRMFRGLLDDLDLSQRVLGWRDGERRMTDLLHLAELIHSEASRARLGPRGTMSWLRRQIEEPEEEGDTAGLRLESDADAVDVITIHKAKGLQYPVVFCPFLWTGFRSPDQHLLRYHDAEGVRRLDPSPKMGSEYPAEKQARIAAAGVEAEAEDMRLLYVSLTRAKHRCVVYWGGFNGAEGSPLLRLLHGDAPVKLGSMSDDDLLEPLHRIAHSSDAAIEVSEQILAQVPVRTYRPLAAQGEAPLRAREWSRRAPLDTWWRRGSFTGLTRSNPLSPEAGKEDDEVLEHAGEAGRDVPDADEREITLSRALLPGGRQTGIFLHALYEHLDLTCPEEELRAAVEEKLEAFGLDPAKLAAPLVRAMSDVLLAPLDDGAEQFRLADVSPGDRLRELDFDFPVAGGLQAAGQVTRHGLEDVFAAHRSAAVPAAYAERVGRLGFQPLRGFLTGAIDLVFRRGGRWYLADYKSSHLGDRVADYAPALLPEVMSEGHYFLQYHLYALALHRWLRWRVPGYTYEAGFGGVFYLFLRGMSPRDDRVPYGVFFDRPKPEMIAALDDLMLRGDGGRP